MGRATTITPMNHHVPSPNHNSGSWNNTHDLQPVQLCGSIFGFLEDGATVLTSPENNTHDIQQDDNDDEFKNTEHNAKFWEIQHINLQKTLCKTTGLESKIRNKTKEVLGEVEMAEIACFCSRPVPGGCRGCRMREICSRLQKSGYDSAICKSKWNNSVHFPSGQHTFLDVIDTSNHKQHMVRVIIELEFRGHFEMKKGSDEYNNLVRKLPDLFVGKSERLQTVIKILSTAVKECMKEKKMHLGPWRTQRYMQAKWLRVTERSTVTTMNKHLVQDECSTRPARVKTSMLTLDLHEDFSNISC